MTTCKDAKKILPPVGMYFLIRPQGERGRGEKYVPIVAVKDGKGRLFDTNNVLVRFEHHRQGVEWAAIPE